MTATSLRDLRDSVVKKRLISLAPPASIGYIRSALWRRTASHKAQRWAKKGPTKGQETPRAYKYIAYVASLHGGMWHLQCSCSPGALAWEPLRRTASEGSGPLDERDPSHARGAQASLSMTSTVSQWRLRPESFGARPQAKCVFVPLCTYWHPNAQPRRTCGTLTGSWPTRCGLTGHRTGDYRLHR